MNSDVWVTLKSTCPYCEKILEFEYILNTLPNTIFCEHCHNNIKVIIRLQLTKMTIARGQ